MLEIDLRRFQNYRHLLYTRAFHPRVGFGVFLGKQYGTSKKRYLERYLYC